MKSKFLKGLAGCLLASTMLLGFVGCGDNGGNSGNKERGTFDNENDSLVFSTLEVDGVFSPFFATSATDGNIVGMTQLGMLANDENGDPAYGDDEPVITKDLQIVDNGGVEDGDLQTTYYFVLKNDVKFSNGSPLTIKDVLFNYYIYLDPVYTGSSTIYSTDIVGLKEYRTQQGTEAEQEQFMTNFESHAKARINALAQAGADIIKNEGDTNDSEQFKTLLQAYQDSHSGNLPEGQFDANAYLVKDYEHAVKLFKEELENDFSNSLNSYEDTSFTDAGGTEHKNVLKSDVEMFLYNEGLIEWDRNGNNKNGELKYLVDMAMLEGWNNDYADSAKKDAAKQSVIDYVFNTKMPADLEEIIFYWATSATLYQEITNEELSAYNEELEKHPEEIRYKNISGIKWANFNETVTVNGVEYAPATYNNDGSVKEGNEVLSITINNVDPKAIWNFALSIAPMYYYSPNGGADFDYANDNFGVKRGNSEFMNQVRAINKVPVGAGPYAASDSDGVNVAAGELPTAGDFHSQSVIYFERNPYYIGGPAKIKKIRFQVSTSNNMLNNLYGGTIDYAEPNAKPENVNDINGRTSRYGHKEVTTLGYGYIGINAGKVPSVYVRQAIMHSINTSLCVQYYQSLANPIHRPMSTESWAYPKGATAYYPYIGDPIPADLSVVNPAYRDFVTSKGFATGYKMTVDEQREFIDYLVGDLGEYGKNGNGTYTSRHGQGTDVCKYTFTVVGETDDHPAWQALFLAGQFLNSCGFEINVRTDWQGLQKLNNGDLTVWAAAWGSTIDPDMYQVYHKDSQATSVLNWGYRQILQNAGGKYDDEYGIVNDLSDVIDEARKIDSSKGLAERDERAGIYSTALDLVMQLAVELPTYQRMDMFAYNTYKIDETSFFQNPTSFKGLTSDMHLVSLNVAQ